MTFCFPETIGLGHKDQIEGKKRKGLTPLKKEERKNKKQREDQVLNRVLWWFGGAVALEFLLLILNRYYIGFETDGIQLARNLAVFLKGLALVGLAAMGAAGGWWWHRRKEKGPTLAPGGCFLAATAVCVCSLVPVLWPAVGVQLLYIVVPAVAVLALIYYLYQREFFLVTVEGVLALFAMWGYRKLIYSLPAGAYGICGVVAVATVTVLAVTYLAWKKGGEIKGWKLFGKQTVGLPLVYVGGGITLAALLVALIGGATAAYIALFAVVAWLFAAAVFYTVRLM